MRLDRMMQCKDMKECKTTKHIADILAYRTPVDNGASLNKILLGLREISWAPFFGTPHGWIGSEHLHMEPILADRQFNWTDRAKLRFQLVETAPPSRPAKQEVLEQQVIATGDLYGITDMLVMLASERWQGRMERALEEIRGIAGVNGFSKIGYADIQGSWMNLEVSFEFLSDPEIHLHLQFHDNGWEWASTKGSVLHRGVRMWPGDVTRSYPGQGESTWSSITGYCHPGELIGHMKKITMGKQSCT